VKQFPPELRGHHVLVHTDNTSEVTYINNQRGPFANWCPPYQILLLTQGKLQLLRAVFIPGCLNQEADWGNGDD